MAAAEDTKKAEGKAAPKATKDVVEEKALVPVPSPEPPAGDSKALVVFEGEYQSCFARSSCSIPSRAVWFLQIATHANSASFGEKHMPFWFTNFRLVNSFFVYIALPCSI